MNGISPNSRVDEVADFGWESEEVEFFRCDHPTRESAPPFPLDVPETSLRLVRGVGS